jgi:hypothetical protein
MMEYLSMTIRITKKTTITMSMRKTLRVMKVTK